MLPKIKTILFETIIPSTKEKIKFRSFTVKEEKILLLAQADESEDANGVILAIQQILMNCIVGVDIDIEKLPTYDIEYLFLQVRSKSISNTSKISILDGDKSYFADLDLDTVEVQFPPNHDPIIVLDDDVSIVLSDPTLATVHQISKEGLNSSTQYDILKESIVSVVVGDDVVLLKDHTLDEQEIFIESFSRANMEKIEEFFATVPKLAIDVEFVSEDGEKITREVSGLVNFFM